MIGLVLFTVFALLIALVTVFRRSAFIEAPTAVALLSLAWILPQGLKIYEAGTFTETSQDLFWLWAAACLATFWLGFRYAVGRKPNEQQVRPGTRHDYLEQRLQVLALLMVLIGATSLQIASALAIDLGTQWTGPATLFFMFGQLLNWGFCLITLLFLRNPSKTNLFIIMIAVILLLFQMSGYLKRNAVFELAAIVAGSMYFVRQWKPSLPLLVLAVLFGSVLIHEVAAIRYYTKTYNVSTYEAVISGVPFEAIQREGSVSTTELSQAISDVENVNATGQYDLGASFWNKFVHRWVPAFIVGQNVKDSLKFQSSETDQSGEILSFMGATRTGFSDSYKAFSVFGVLIFFILGRIVGYFYRKGSGGDISGQYLYLIILNDSLIAFTEATSRFFVNLPWSLGIALLVFAIARHRPKKSAPAVFPRKPDVPTFETPVLESQQR